MTKHQRTPDKRLHAIAGHWQTSGHLIREPETLVIGTDTYDVLPGGYFLVHHVDVTVGNGESMTALWERSEDGTDWQDWMAISFTRSD